MQKFIGAPAEKTNIEVGYLRLTDSAPFLVARDIGFFKQFGLNVTLRQEISWANVRDKLVTGSLDAAQMLAPLPAMISLGASGLREPMLTGLVLSNHGNSITLNQTIRDEAYARIEGGECASLLAALKIYSEQNQRKLTFATVHAFSSHTLLLRRWLRSADIDPDNDIKLLIVPPSQMVDSLQANIIDGFCAGEPWNTIAAQTGAGSIVALGSEIWPRTPEKILGVSAKWHRLHPNTHLRLRMALLQSCKWLADSNNRALATRILAQPDYLNLPEEYIAPSLTKKFIGSADTVNPPTADNHLFYGDNLNRPDLSITSQMIKECAELLGRPLDPSLVQSLAQQSCRPDLFEETTFALEATDVSGPT